MIESIIINGSDDKANQLIGEIIAILYERLREVVEIASEGMRAFI